MQSSFSIRRPRVHVCPRHEKSAQLAWVAEMAKVLSSKAGS
jgi:hypothetical protein